MIRKVLALFSLVSLLLLTPEFAFAKTFISPSPSAMPVHTIINSNELFWPLSAGKTVDESLYFLKRFKEKVRGLLIFGDSQKADYEVFLGTKRVLEAEKLLKEGRNDFANKTFDEALEQFREAEENVTEASSKKRLSSDNVATMKPRLTNLVDFLPTLMSDKANEVLQKVSELNSKL